MSSTDLGLGQLILLVGSEKGIHMILISFARPLHLTSPTLTAPRSFFFLFFSQQVRYIGY